jgi:hypothetical protein
MALVVAVVVVLVLAVLAPVAGAVPKQVGGFVGSATAGPSRAPGGSFNQPRDVALFHGGTVTTADDKLFVADTGFPAQVSQGNRVQRLDGDGNFERLWGRDVDGAGGSGAAEICLVAADCAYPLPTNGAGRGEFSRPTGLAVDQADGWVWVYDRSNFRIQKFDLDGNFLLMFGFDVNQTVAGTGFEVCTQTSGDVCKIGLAGSGAGQLGNLSSSSSTAFPKLAVDQASGDVFVADPVNRRIQRYTSAGGFVSGFGVAGTTATPGEFGTNQPQHVAIDSNGIVYASDATDGNEIERYDTNSSTFLGQIKATNSAPTAGPLLAVTAATAGIAIDPDTDAGGPDEEHLLVVRDPASGNTVVQELDIPAPATDPVTTVVDTHTFADQPTLGGVAANPRTGSVFLPINLSKSVFTACPDTSTATTCTGLAVLNVAGPVAVVGAPPAPVGTTTATLRATVDVNGLGSYQFQLAKGGGDFTDVGTLRYVGGSTDIPVSVLATGLDPNAFYRTRVIVSKVTSLTTTDSATSGESIFLTAAAPPDAVTSPIGPRTSTSAELRGTVDPNGSAATYYFQYGPDATYGTNVPALPASVGSGNSPLAVAQQVTGLLPETTYHYRLVADNGVGGPVFGADQTFTTQSAETTSVLGDRAYELVTPRYKSSGPGVGGHGGNSALDGDANVFTGVPSLSGDRLVANTIGGPVLTNDGASVYVHDYALSGRGVGGWHTEPAFNLRNYGNPQIPFRDIVAADEELSLMAWRGSGDSRLFPEETGTAGQLRDWAGHWRSLAGVSSGTAAFATSVTSVAPAVDGSAVAYSGQVVGQGLLGDGDPSADQLSGGGLDTAYLVELGGGISGVWEDRGPTALLGSCLPGTQLPERLVSGKLDSQDCPLPVEYSPGEFRSEGLISTRGSSISSGSQAEGSMRNVVSAGGVRAFFMSPDPTAPDPDAAGPLTGGGSPCGPGTGAGTSCPAQLYVRQRDESGGVTVRWVSQPQVPDQDAALLGPAYFEGASRDGDKVFFGTASPLTVDDPNGLGAPTAGGVTTESASNDSWDLYSYDLPDGLDGDPATPDADPAGGSLTRVSAGPLGTGDCNTSADSGAGALRFVSDDGSRVYFTCAAPLPGVPAPGSGTITGPGGTQATTDTVNLYLYDENRPALSDRWTFIARLPRATEPGDVNTCATTGTVGGESRTTAFSGDWSYTLIAQARTCVHGTPDGGFVTFWTPGRLVVDDPDAASADVYGFDAVADELVRLSGPQGGVGGSYTCVTVGDVQCYGDPGFLSGSGDTFRRSQLGVAVDPTFGGDRLAFFQSRSRLVAQDTDAHMDVYQWRNGDLSLISTGIEDANAYYSGNSGSGRDVFLVTDKRLTWEDVDGVRDVYDARVGGGFVEPAAPVLCAVLVDACQGRGTGVSTPVQPETSSLAGDGNVVSGERKRVTLGKLPLAQRRRAARSGVIRLRVRSNKAGRVSVVAKGRVGKKMRRVGGASKRLSKPGVTTVRIKLSRVARKQLRRGRALKVTLRVTSAGARPKSMKVALRRAGR